MCGRFTLTYPDADMLAEALGAVLDPDAAAAYRPRYNAAPSETYLVLRSASGRRELGRAQAAPGVPRWAGAAHRGRGSSAHTTLPSPGTTSRPQAVVSAATRCRPRPCSSVKLSGCGSGVPRPVCCHM